MNQPVIRTSVRFDVKSTSANVKHSECKETQINLIYNQFIQLIKIKIDYLDNSKVGVNINDFP